MGVKDSFGRMAAWFGFGVDEEDYYLEEEEEGVRARGESARQREIEPEPTVRRLGRSERSPSSSYGGSSLGDIFGESRERSSGGAPARLRAVPDQRPTRVSVVEPTSFNDAQDLADRFKRQQPVILNLQNVDSDLSRRMVDFCSGLTYALEGQIQTVASRVFLLTPRNVEVSAEERKRLAERAFFNQL
ncbi:cell division protein SepF [Rubrobacter calidifluminis]|uniref:cell division protein SepF n=1 Tax=Rubrobacter calidifluminis TaxID=1392640 RepID=UPI0023600541|nr:cell division protein SepF [Rubrobacter calidifluminis]